MPHGLTKFNNAWLMQKDENGHELHSWCKKDSNSEYSGYCSLCCKSVQCSNNGVKQLLNHAQGMKHKELAKTRFGRGQKHFITAQSSGPSKLQGGGDAVKHIELQNKTLKEQVTTAEILWVLKVASAGITFSSCDETPALFQTMFPGPISKEFKMSRTKASYMLSDGLGPYFRESIAKLICDNKVFYTIQFDETGNAQGRKQCDILLRFWNVHQGLITTQYLKSVMFGHAKGKDVAVALLDTLNEKNYELPLCQLVSIGSDGPNVNKTIWKYIDSHMKEAGLKGLVNFIACPLHVVHNAFRKGMDVYGQQAEDLSIDLFQWFKTHPCQKEDFATTLDKLNIEGDVFLRHVQCRWLTLVPCLQRIKDNWKPTYHYFLKDLPEISQRERTIKQLKGNERYKRICQALKSKETLIQMNFLLGIGLLFQEYETNFQKQEPLIHTLYPESVELLKKVLMRFLKFEVVSGKSGSKLVDIDCESLDNCKPLTEMDIGQEVKEGLLTLENGQQKFVQMEMRRFYQEVSKHLSKKLPIQEPVVKNAQCLHPEVRNQDRAMKMISQLSSVLPNLTSDDVTKAVDEWKIYREENVEDNVVYNEDGMLKRVDSYWNNILERKTAAGMLKYPGLRKVVMSCLCLFHGNADVERSLSINKKILTPERSLLSDAALNGLRLTRDAVCLHGNVHTVPITKKMISYVQGSYKKYQERLEEERSEAELVKRKRAADIKDQEEHREKLKNNDERKRKLSQKEGEMKANEMQLEEDLNRANSVFEEANNRLTDGIKEKNFHKISIAQGLLEVAKKNLDQTRAAMEKCREKRNEIDVKRRKLLESVPSLKDCEKDKKA